MEALLRQIREMAARWVVWYTGVQRFTGSIDLEINFNEGKPVDTYVNVRRKVKKVQKTKI